jgi:hypothetical protein
MKTSNENDASPTDIDRDAPAIIRLERVIPAHRQRIWDLHADVAGWPKWQLDIATASIDGPLAAGSALTGRRRAWTSRSSRRSMRSNRIGRPCGAARPLESSVSIVGHSTTPTPARA